MVAGGGAIEMELSKYLRDYSRSIAGKEQLIIAAMAKALEVSVLKIQNVFHDECTDRCYKLPFPRRSSLVSCATTPASMPPTS